MDQLANATYVDMDVDGDFVPFDGGYDFLMESIHKAFGVVGPASTTSPLPPAEQELNSSQLVDGESGGYGGFRPPGAALCSVAEPGNMYSLTGASNQGQDPNPQFVQNSSGGYGEFMSLLEGPHKCVNVGQVEPIINQGTHFQPYSQGQNNNVPALHIPEGQQSVGYINGMPVYLKPEAFAPPATTSKSKKRKRDDTEQDRPYVKKPLNAFMLYMKEQRPKYVAEMKVTGTAQVNKALGEKWKLLSDVEKAKYYEEARKQQRLHEEQHPDWSARANYGKKRKRVRRKAANVAEGQTYEDVPQPAKKQRSTPAAVMEFPQLVLHPQPWTYVNSDLNTYPQPEEASTAVYSPAPPVDTQMDSALNDMSDEVLSLLLGLP